MKLQQRIYTFKVGAGYQGFLPFQSIFRAVNLLWAPWKKPLNFRASWRRAPVLEHGARLSPEQEIILGFGSVWILGWRGEWPHPPHRGTNSTLCCPLKIIQSMILSHLMAAALDCCEQSSDKPWIREEKPKKAQGKKSQCQAGAPETPPATAIQL